MSYEIIKKGEATGQIWAGKPLFEAIKTGEVCRTKREAERRVATLNRGGGNDYRYRVIYR